MHNQKIRGSPLLDKDTHLLRPVNAFQEKALVNTAAVLRHYWDVCGDEIKNASKSALTLMNSNKSQGKPVWDGVIQAIKGNVAFKEGASYTIGLLNRDTKEIEPFRGEEELDDNPDKYVLLELSPSDQDTASFDRRSTLEGEEIAIRVSFNSFVYSALATALKFKGGNVTSLESLLPYVLGFVKSRFSNVLSHELTHYEQWTNGKLNPSEEERALAGKYKLYRDRRFTLEQEADSSLVASFYANLLKGNKHTPEYVNSQVVPSHMAHTLFHDWKEATPDDILDVIDTAKRLEDNGLMTEKFAQSVKKYLADVLRHRGSSGGVKDGRNPSRGSYQEYKDAVGNYEPKATFLKGKFLKEFWETHKEKYASIIDKVINYL